MSLSVRDSSTRPDRYIPGDGHHFGGSPKDEIAEFFIVVIYPCALSRECLYRCLVEDVGENSVVAVATLKDWLDISSKHPKPDLIVWYTGSPSKLDEQSYQNVADLSRSGEFPPVVLLSDTEDAGEILGALEMGAKGVIPTSVSLEVAIKALRLVRAGGTFVPVGSLISARSAAESKAEEKSEASRFFTERQEAVVRALRQGKANKIIAYELNMQESTVKVHIRNVMRKLKATNRTEVAYLTRHMFEDS